MKHLKNQKIEDIEIELTDKEQSYLGPNLILERCRLVLRTSSRAMTITDCQLLDCKIEARKKLVNCQMWCGSKIKGCEFVGNFAGNDFGHWPEQHPHGSIENCDFTNAILDGCRFMDCDISSIRLPLWPCFSILNPHQLGNEIEKIDWPGKLRFWAEDLPYQPSITQGLVEHAPSIATQFACTEEKLRESLQQLIGVIM